MEKQCTLNRTIKTMLTGKRKFNIEYIKKRISENPGIIDNSTYTNTLSHVMKYSTNNNNYKISQIKELIEYLVSVGAKPANNCRNENMYHYNKSQLSEFANYMFGMSDTKPTNYPTIGFSSSKNHDYRMGGYHRKNITDLMVGSVVESDLNTLNLSFETQCIDVVKIIRKIGTEPDNTFTNTNTYIRALKTGNPLIVKEAIIAGAKIPMESVEHFVIKDYSHRWKISDYYQVAILISFYKLNSKHNNINQLIELMIMSGLPIGPNYSGDNKLVSDYCDLMTYHLDRLNNKNPILKKNVINLLDRQRNLRNEMIDLVNENKEKKLELIFVVQLPTCCIDIVHEYNMGTEIRPSSGIMIQDWDKILNL